MDVANTHILLGVLPVSAYADTHEACSCASERQLQLRHRALPGSFYHVRFISIRVRKSQTPTSPAAPEDSI